jgi:hypothetical protein
MGVENVVELVPLIHRLELVGLIVQKHNMVLLTNPIPLITARMYRESLTPALRKLYDDYMGAFSIDLALYTADNTNQTHLFLDAPAEQQVVIEARERKTVSDAHRLVEFFRKTLAERLGGEDFIFRGNERGVNIRIANAMLRNYSFEECCDIIREYLKDDYRARQCGSLKPIARSASVYLNIIKGLIPGATSQKPRRGSRIIDQGDISIYGARDWA